MHFKKVKELSKAQGRAFESSFFEFAPRKREASAKSCRLNLKQDFHRRSHALLAVQRQAGVVVGRPMLDDGKAQSRTSDLP